MAPVAYSSNTPPLKQAPAHMRLTPEKAALEDLMFRVRETSDRMQRALSPFAERIKVFAEAHPVVFTFTSIFVALSCIPVACALLFVLCSVLLFTVIATFLLCLGIVGMVGLAMTFLTPVLIITATLSAMAVCVLLALFLAHRLLLHIRSSCEHSPGLSGVLNGIHSWVDETLGRIGVGASEYGPHFDGRSIDHHRQTHVKPEPHGRLGEQSRKPSRERRYEYEHRSQVSLVPPTIKPEHEVHDMFSPESGTQELRSRASQINNDDDGWVSDEGPR
ncbi:hypothetical protein CspeluHIS016_0203300 [Cutaneotrichosporon spelunceum]|uniref:Uncharacterized protein n=1 Tax=Cutaneotrichosporon spelunceum TaxID=1672016 RepID=A0AAD3TR88_9TREE|nr:hypothetical protein CspeluHIS016_0203300 [Cutaneotrichosporon spelunceum]